MVGKNLGNRARVSNLLNHPPQSRKMAKNGQFRRIILPNAQHRFASLAVATMNKIPGTRTVQFFRFGLGSTALSNFGSVPAKVQIN